jgi:hypothetical protein
VKLSTAGLEAITDEDATHVVVTLEIPKATLRKMQRFIQALLAITVAE